MTTDFYRSSANAETLDPSSLLGLVVMWVVSMLVFTSTEILPGDVAQAVLGHGDTPEAIANIRERLWLNDPAYVRYFDWLRGLSNPHAWR